MKRLFLIFLLVYSHSFVKAQNIGTDSIGSSKPAGFSGGNPKDYIQSNLIYPRKARKQRIEGTVTVIFTIDTTGSIINARVLKSTNPMLDSEALRVINSMPNWEPGILNGKLVQQTFKIEIKFHRKK